MIPTTPLRVETLLRSTAGASCGPGLGLASMDADPLRFLVSVDHTPEQAAEAYFAQRRGGIPEPLEGWVRLTWWGEDLETPQLWDSVAGRWAEIIGAIGRLLEASDEDILGSGVELLGVDGLPGTRLEPVHGGILAVGFGPRRLRSTVEEFLPPLLAGARRYAEFQRDHLGLGEQPPMRVLDGLDRIAAKTCRDAADRTGSAPKLGHQL